MYILPPPYLAILAISKMLVCSHHRIAYVAIPGKHFFESPRIPLSSRRNGGGINFVAFPGQRKIIDSMKAFEKFLRYGIYMLLTSVGLAAVLILALPYRWIGAQIFQRVHHLRQADAIVVLFGDGNGKGTAVGRESHRRVVYGVKLFREGYAKKIIFSGGYPDGADLMVALALELGVAPQDMLVENRSRDTISNFDNTARLVQAQHGASVLLVSTASHVARALRIINAHGLTIYPAAVPYDTCEPPYTRAELMQALWHDAGAYALYVVAGKQAYERVVAYVRKGR